MTTELKQAAQQAVDAFEAFGDADDFASLFELTQKIRALRTAIQQAESDHARLPGVLKDHQIAAMVNSLRDIARQFHGHDSLRERIANVLVPALKAEAKTDEPVHALLDNANPLLVFAIESEMGVYQEHEIPTAARNAIKASKTYTNPAPGVPDGYALVPIEPTQEMLAAVSWPECARTDWAHMLAASPAQKGSS